MDWDQDDQDMYGHNRSEEDDYGMGPEEDDYDIDPEEDDYDIDPEEDDYDIDPEEDDYDIDPEEDEYDNQEGEGQEQSYQRQDQEQYKDQTQQYLNVMQQRFQSQQNQQQHLLSLLRRYQVLNQTQVKYLRDIKDNANIQYFKQEFKFDQKVRDIYLSQYYLNARDLFQSLKKQAIGNGFDLCQVTIKTYVKDYSDKQKQYQQKLVRYQRQIGKILEKYCYGENVKMTEQSGYKAVPISYNSYQFIHFTLKLKSNIKEADTKVKKAKWNLNLNGRKIPLTIGANKYVNKDYLTVTNHSYCNNLKTWEIGCRVKSKEDQYFYSYFKPEGEHFITFSRSMNQIQEGKSNIKEICLYNSFSSNNVLRTIVKKEQIYLITYLEKTNQVYFFISSPPIYEFSMIPPNTYCPPNYLNNWDRVQNFLFLNHRDFKNNDFLRLYLYSNSYIRITLDKLDPQSCQNVKMDISLLQIELNCQNQPLSENAKHSEIIPDVLNILNSNYFRKALEFIDIPNKPVLTKQLRWKFSYQLMLLIRFNVVNPEDLNDFLKFVDQDKKHLDDILDCLSKRSAGYTNKVAALNRSRRNTYEKLKQRVEETLSKKQLISNQQKRKKMLSDNSCFIYKVSLTPSGILPNPISPQTKCRLIRQYADLTQFFIKVTLLDDAGEPMKNQKYLYNKIMRKQLDKITILGKQYVPLGWSGSQLRGSSLWYVNEIEQAEGEIRMISQASILNFLGDFKDIRVPAKKAARIGQAFSSSYFFDSSQIQEKITKDDISSKKYLFTDGIGKISRDLFSKICQQFKKNNIRIQCCLQIRYKGAKGVLLVNDELSQNTIVLRESMVKYPCNDPAAKKYLDILSWDKYLPGYLNRQIIILLKSLEIQDKAFLEFQREYIELLKNLDFDTLDGNLLRIFNDSEQNEDSFVLTISSLRGHFDLKNDLFFKQFLESVKDTKFTELKKKSRILIKNSARLIGVIDDYGVLEEGELYCAIMPHNNHLNAQKKVNQNKQTIKGFVIITRNPSLSPADVRKCKCISEQEIKKRFQNKKYPQNYFKDYANCIVFPKKGAIPLTAQISGSDLDGDIFFICWDQKFLIRNQQPCQTIDDPDKKSAYYYGNAGYKEMLDFFVNFANNEKLGRINNTHLVIADKSKDFANDRDCKRLAKIHGKAVDYAKSGEPPENVPQDLNIREYPDFMEKWNKPYYQSQSIMGKLYRQCVEQIQQRKQQQTSPDYKIEQNLMAYFPKEGFEKSTIYHLMAHLAKFEEDITDLLNHSNLKSQFQLYSGSSEENDELRNQFGRKRLADWLEQTRKRHQQQFLGSSTISKKDKIITQFQNYRSLKGPSIKSQKAFSQKLKQKTLLAYIISYFCYCSKENVEIFDKAPQKMKKLYNQIKQLQNNKFFHYEGLYLGFIWFVVPKIMINMRCQQKKK